MKFKLISLLLVTSITISVATWQHQGTVKLSAWDNTLYGQPICTKIPPKMSLCNNINYQQMKVPNLLGHESVPEIVSQSAAWNPLLGIKCHADTQLFLCSLFAPVCIDQAVQATIYPCKSLCEQVRDSCQAPMMAYNYPWPNMFNCSQFPEDNGFCIKPSNQMRPVTMEITTLPPRTTESNKYRGNHGNHGNGGNTNAILRGGNHGNHGSSGNTNTMLRGGNHGNQGDNTILRDGNQGNQGSNQCKACQNTKFDMANVIKGYCHSRIAMRGRVNLFDQSSIDLGSSAHQFSNHMVIPRRERRFFKGARILFATNGPFLTEATLRDYFEHRTSEVHFTRRSDLDFFMLSNDHVNVLNRQRSNMGRKNRIGNRSSNGGHCKCELLEANLQRKRYFITANVRRVRKQMVRQKRNGGKSSSMRRDYRAMFKRTARFLKKNFRFVEVTGVWQWSLVRPFIDYLENFKIDKSGMCANVEATLKAVQKADEMFF